MARGVPVAPRREIHVKPPFGGMVNSPAYVAPASGDAIHHATSRRILNALPVSVNPVAGSTMTGNFRMGMRPGFKPAYGNRFGQDIRIQGVGAQVTAVLATKVLSFATNNPDWTQYGIQVGDEVIFTGNYDNVNTVASVSSSGVVLTGDLVLLSTNINFLIQDDQEFPIRLLGEVIPGDQEQLSFLDDFDDGVNGDYLHGPWQVARWINPTYVPQYDGNGNIYVTNHDNRGVWNSSVVYDVSKPYEINFRCLKDGSDQRGSYRVYFRLNDTTPNAAVYGVAITATMDDGNGDYTVKLDHYLNSVRSGPPDATGTLSTAADADFTLQVVVTKNRYVTVRLIPQGATRVDAFTNVDIGALVPAAGLGEGSRFAFGMQKTNNDSHKVLSDFFQFLYFPVFNPVNSSKKILYTSAGGKFYIQRNPNLVDWDLVDSLVRLQADLPLQSISSFGDVYIADFADPKVIGVGTGVLTAGVLTDTRGIDFSVYGIDIDEDMVLIYDADTNAVNKTYLIESFPAVTSVKVVGTPSATFCSYRIQRGAKRYSTTTGILALFTTDGTDGQPPLGCDSICVYRGRLVWAGGSNPFILFFSRINDFNDYDYGDTDSAAAFEATRDEIFGVAPVRDTITCIIPSINNDFLIVGCQASIWIVRGDPRQGGGIQILCPTYGILPGKAWDYGPDGSIYFMSNRGLCSIPPNGSPPTNLSENKIPWKLLVSDTYRFTGRAFISYDKRVNGIHIYISLNDDEADEPYKNYFYHLAFQGFFSWLLRFDAVTQIAAFNDYWYTASPVLFGSSTGRIYAFRDEFYGDVANGITPVSIGMNVVYGPFSTGQTRRSTILELQITTAADSASLNGTGAVIRIYSANSAEEAWLKLEAGVANTYWLGILSDARQQQFLFRPMRGGNFHYVELRVVSSLTKSWAIEDMTLTLEDSGKALLVS